MSYDIFGGRENDGKTAYADQSWMTKRTKVSYQTGRLLSEYDNKPSVDNLGVIYTKITQAHEKDALTARLEKYVLSRIVKSRSEFLSLKRLCGFPYLYEEVFPEPKRKKRKTAKPKTFLLTIEEEQKKKRSRFQFSVKLIPCDVLVDSGGSGDLEFNASS